MKNKSSIDTKDQPTCLCIDPIFWNEPCPAHPDKATPTASDTKACPHGCGEFTVDYLPGHLYSMHPATPPTALSSIDEIIQETLLIFIHNLDLNRAKYGEVGEDHFGDILNETKQALEAHIAEHYVPKAEVTRARIDELENRLRVQFISSHWERLRSETNSWAKYVDRRIDELKATLNTKGDTDEQSV